jgi:hypothetical protein
MPRNTFRITILRAASALAITVALASPAASGQTLRGVTAPTAPPASNDNATVTNPPTIDGVAVGQPTSGGALAPPLLFHVDPNAFTPLARPVIIPPRATTGSPFGLTAPGPAVSPTGDRGTGTSSGAGVPIDPSGGVIVTTPTGGSARGDLLAGPSLRRGAGATRNLTIGGEASGRIVMPRENFGNVSRFTGDVVITNRESGRTRIVTR